MRYCKLDAIPTKATIFMVNKQLIIKNDWAQRSGGQLSFESKLAPKATFLLLESYTKINWVAIVQFLTFINNFDIQSYKPKNIKGFLSTSYPVKETLLSEGQFMPNSVAGNAKITISKGKFVTFETIIIVVRCACSFRDIGTIVFHDCSSNCKPDRALMEARELKVSPNVLILDVNDVCSFSNGTRLALNVPSTKTKKKTFIPYKRKRAEKCHSGNI